MQNNQVAKSVRDTLWARGELSWLLHDYQNPVYMAIRDTMKTDALKFVLNISRRFGKSTILCLIAIEEAMRNPDSQIKFTAPTAKETKKSIKPIMLMLLKTCPKRIKPEFKTGDNCWDFPNGSQIHINGVNGESADNIRGGRSDLSIVDEAGQVDELDYLVKSVLMPMGLTTDALMIIASTPSITPDHDYFDYYAAAKKEGYLSEFTVHDNTSLPEKRIAKIMADCGGETSTTWRREYLVEFVVDSAFDIVPEWKKIYSQDVEDFRDDYYNFYHKYVAMDIGVIDLTGILYGYYDFQRGTLFIQAETTLDGDTLTTDDIAAQVVMNEKELFKGSEPYKRISDNNNLILLHDLTILHDMPFIATLKDNLDAQVNALRLFVNEGRLIVDPSCEMLLGCLESAVWSKSKTRREFAKSKVYGHYDHLAALVYLVRNLNQYENPIPAGLGVTHANTYVKKDAFATNNGVTATLKKVFNQ